MKKQRLFLDYDGTIVESIKAYCDTYNILYKNESNFIPADWTKSATWDLKDQCPLVENANDIFGSKTFFEVVDFIDKDTKSTIDLLTDQYEVIICSIGIPSNLSYKSLWLEKHLPSVKDYILLCNNGCKMDKSIVNMSNGIFIDDIASNLITSNAKYKFLFGREFSWNKTDVQIYKRFLTYNQLGKFLLN